MNTKLIIIFTILLVVSNAATYRIFSSSVINESIATNNTVFEPGLPIVCPSSQYDKDMEEADTMNKAAYEAALRRHQGKD